MCNLWWNPRWQSGKVQTCSKAATEINIYIYSFQCDKFLMLCMFMGWINGHQRGASWVSKKENKADSSSGAPRTWKTLSSGTWGRVKGQRRRTQPAGAGHAFAHRPVSGLRDGVAQGRRSSSEAGPRKKRRKRKREKKKKPRCKSKQWSESWIKAEQLKSNSSGIKWEAR